MPVTFQQCLHSRHISKIYGSISCRCSSFGKKWPAECPMPAPSILRVQAIDYIQPTCYPTNTFDWTHGICLGSVHNNKNTRNMFHVGFRQSIAATSKTTRTRTYVVPQHRYHKHSSAAGAYKSPSSLDIRPFIQFPRPAIPGQKAQLQSGYVSAFS